MWFTRCVAGLPARYVHSAAGPRSIGLAQIFRTESGGFLGTLDTFGGGAIQRMAMFALNITPYIAASIIVQFIMTKEGEQGRKAMNRYMRYPTVPVAAAQSYGIVVGLERLDVVTEPGLFFRLSPIIILTGGAVFVMWLSEQITSHGIGKGISVIILSGLAVELPGAIAGTLELGRLGGCLPGSSRASC